jgi:hypothetical protein
MKRSEMNRFISYGWLFLFVSLVVNYIYRKIFHDLSLENIIMGSDMQGYYQYLVHFFIRDWADFDKMLWAIPYSEGKTLCVYTCGVAILWSPFFLFAHFINIFFGLEATGHTNIYYGFMLIGGIFYTYVGLVFIYKFLRELFDHKISLLTIFLLFLTTNLFFYSVLLGAGMAHAYSFSMIAIYIYYTHKFFKANTLKNLVLLGIPFALAVLIRPTNLISGLYLFLYGVSSVVSLKERIRFWIKNYWAIIALFFIGVIVFIPQMAYWHFVSGKFLLFSYMNSGFPYLLSPKFGIVLFGKYNGWLIYTPIVLFALVGLFILLLRKQLNSLAVLLILIICIYVNASWCEPTFSAAVGQRAMIDYLPLLAIPLATMISQIRGMPKTMQIVFGIVILVLIFYNIQFGFRYNSGMWWGTPMSWTKFWTTLKF